MHLNITFEKTLERLGIVQAREKHAVITEIVYMSSDANKLRESLDKWIEKENVCLSKFSEKSCTYTYGGPSYNGRTLNGREYTKTEIFSTFQLTTNSDGGHINRMTFSPLTSQDIEDFRKYKNYNPKKTPSLLQIFYGLKKKYKGIMLVSGYFDIPDEEKSKLNDLEPSP